MGATEFYQTYGIEPEELLNGESAQHYAMRVLAQHQQSSISTGVRYSYGSLDQSSESTQSSHQLYTY